VQFWRVNRSFLTSLAWTGHWSTIFFFPDRSCVRSSPSRLPDSSCISSARLVCNDGRRFELAPRKGNSASHSSRAEGAFTAHPRSQNLPVLKQFSISSLLSGLFGWLSHVVHLFFLAILPGDIRMTCMTTLHQYLVFARSHVNVLS
jgi:hypothetical protein